MDMPGKGASGRAARYDWQAVERDYRTGKYTLAELSEKYGPHISTISNRSVRERWQQDLTDAVRVATQAEIAHRTLLDAGYVEEVKVSLRDTVEAIAAANATVSQDHARHLTRLRTSLGEMANELGLLGEFKLADGVSLDDVAMVAGLNKEETRSLLNSPRLGYRVQVAEKLVNALSKVVMLERQIHGLDGVPEDKSFESVMARALAERELI